MIDTFSKEITEFNPHIGQTFPITGKSDGTLVQVGFLFNKEKLSKILLSEKENVKIYDTTINGSSYIIHRTDFPDDADFTNKYRLFFINSQTYQIDRIFAHSAYFDQTQIDDMNFSEYQFRNVTNEDIAIEYQNISRGYKMKIYEPVKYENLNIGEQVPNFPVTTYPENLEINLSSENKIVVYDFWYTACLPCAKIFPDMNKVYEKYKDKVEFYAVNVSFEDFNNQNKVTEFIHRIPIKYPIVFCDGETSFSLKVNQFPTLYIVVDGKLYYSHFGFNSEFDLYDFVDKKLGEILLNTK